jgi:hypothetical protein
MKLRSPFSFFRNTCPICYSRDIRFSRRKTTREKILSAFFYIRPFRCRNCWSRFWKLQRIQFRNRPIAASKNIALNTPAPSRFSMTAVFDPVILTLTAFSIGFLLLLSVFPTFAFYGLIICIVTMVSELLSPKY